MKIKEIIILWIRDIRNYLVYLIFIGLIIFTALIVSGKINFSKNIWNTNISINQHVLSWITLWNFKATSWSNYQFTIVEKSENNTWDWITFLSILSTLLAAFFIYSSWKIDNDLKKISKVKDSIKKIEETAVDEMEFSSQLKYAIHYMMSKQYEKAIDALIVLRSESFTLKDSRNLNICYYFLAVCHYEEGINKQDIEMLAKAVQFISEAQDEDQPLRQEIIQKFDEMNTQNNDQN